MPEDPGLLTAQIVTYLSTYLLHSSLLLGAVWLIFRHRKLRDHALSEGLWKFAAVAGLITAPLQISLDASSVVIPIDMQRDVESVVVP